ncbi:MAG: Asp-tRNA(Asn)/Glu-tRNA(Gln) amidotransferase subunit GatC [bacterium]|nr:Asp-tRNA(Asn)/Glu-tRNA(Gln) amidotransferase subunit GatC [bacterium]
MAERISRDEVAHVARLARLRLSEEELERFTLQLGDVLNHAADVAALDLEGVAATSHPYAVGNVLREDVPGGGLDRSEVLAQAPETEAGQFRVPPVRGEAP